MPHFKKILMTAAILAVPGMAFAQSSSTDATDYAKDKAVDTVMDNMTGEDAMVAGETMIKGGSKEDAAMAVVKNRVDGKVDAMTDGMADKAVGSATTYGDKAAGSATTHGDKANMADKAPSSAATYGGAVVPKSQGSATTHSGTATQGSATTYQGTTTQGSSTTFSSGTTTTVAPLNCPAGTTAQNDGTCMITGNWGG